MKNACAAGDAGDNDKKRHPDNSIRPKAVIKLLAVFMAPVILIYLFAHAGAIMSLLDRSAGTRSIRHAAAGAQEEKTPDDAAHGGHYMPAIAAPLARPQK